MTSAQLVLQRSGDRHTGSTGLHGEAQVGRHGQLEQVTAQEAGGEKHHFQILDLAAGGIEPGHYVVAEFLRLLLRVGRTFIDMQDVALAIVRESQFRVLSTTPSASFVAR